MTPLDLAEPTSKLGRPLDLSRDADILDAALDVLAEEGFDGMTVDMVAARAKAGKATLYRRWPSKTELVIDAVACMKNASLIDLPDTGTLRGDLLAIIKPPTMQEGERKMKVMAGLVSLLARNPELADVANKAIVEPRAAINRTLMQRAMDRGEIPADTNIELLALISPSMVSYRTLMLRKPVDRAFLISIIDDIVLPAARGTSRA
jgi:AcrR family transcriptional regulator